MKKSIIYITLLSLVLFSSCDIEEKNINPDAPIKVMPEFLATKVLISATDRPASKWLLDDSWIMKTSSFTEHLEFYLYNKFERDSYEDYNVLINSKKMVKAAIEEDVDEGEMKAYEALNHFIRAYYFYKTSMKMGDVPCSEAAKGEDEGILTPKYDTQEKVFATVLQELEKASTLFGEATNLKGDFIFAGDTKLWQKTANSMTLRVLNMLSKKTTVDGINVQTMFEKVALKPIMENESESFQRVYDEKKSTQWYPFYYEKQNYAAFPVLTSTFVDLMKGLDDRRLFYYGEPAKALSANAEDTYAAYSGVNPVLDFGKVQDEHTKGLHSLINRRYHRVAQGEPIKQIAYSEIQFILAEAALRGWATPKSAKDHYETGVKAAMQFTTIHTPIEHQHGVVIDDTYINNYLQGAAKFDNSKGLAQIMDQKLIASFIQLPYNSYFDYRRTGFPIIPIDPATNLNEVNTQLPKRWMYPQKEYSQNRVNIEAAIQSQYGGLDTPNEVMWILK